ncbi:hypothetical protein QVD17_20384 [Tagetes erecta]|uniref:Uncharacterized protein n=1 Tax=Tagetes erecta TaxID=13708 RepID=A0AAD8NY47_TARER|nr:hypothetical protein QVD17_20384 [Tagetes erecta]
MATLSPKRRRLDNRHNRFDFFDIYKLWQIRFMTSFIMVSCNAYCLSSVFYMFFYSQQVCLSVALESILSCTFLENG